MARRPPADDDALLSRFIASFGRFDDFIATGPIPAELDDGWDDDWRFPRWKPAAVTTDARALRDLYDRIPGPLPTLYERLALSYRWLDVFLRADLKLLANPPGTGLVGLADRIAADAVFVNVLFPLRLVPFATAGESYDPVCFDLGRPRGEFDCRIVRLEHESVLCDDRVGDVWEVAATFRLLVKSIATETSDEKFRR